MTQQKADAVANMKAALERLNEQRTVIDGFLSRKEVLRLTSFSPTTLWREAAAGRFPSPIQISAQRVAWYAAEVADWIKTKLAARDGQK